MGSAPDIPGSSPTAETYEAPAVTDLGSFTDMTLGTTTALTMESSGMSTA